MKILLKFYKKQGEQPKMRYGTNPRVLGQRLASASFYKAKILVTYGKKLDNFDKMTEFSNEGEYFNKKDLQQAFRAFCER